MYLELECIDKLAKIMVSNDLIELDRCRDFTVVA